MAATSGAGRRQLSDEKANSVSLVMPSSGAAAIRERRRLAPAIWPADRGSPRREAHRPLPSMMMAACKGWVIVLGWFSNVLGIAKYPGKAEWGVRSDARRVGSGWLDFLEGQALGGAGRVGAGKCCGGVFDDLLQHIQVIEVAFATGGGDLAERLWAIALKAFGDGNEAFILENLEMAGQVAVGQVALGLEVAKQQAFRVGNQRGEDAEACFLVDGAIKPLVGKAASVGMGCFSRHLGCQS
jgi:hypothetical protein